MNVQNEMSNKEIDTIKKQTNKQSKNQTGTLELRNTVTRLQNSVEHFSNRFNQTEKKKKSVDLKTRYLKSSSQRNKKKRIKKSKESLHDLWDTIQRNSLHITGVPEKEERDTMLI